MRNIEYKLLEPPAANGRFYEMAGSTRPKFCLTLQRQWLVQTVVETRHLTKPLLRWATAGGTDTTA